MNQGEGPTIDMKKKKRIEYDVHEEPLALSRAVMNILLADEKPGDAIALFVFYYHTAKWQESVAAHATISYCAVGLGWGEKKVRTTKQRLMDVNLIEARTRRDPKTKQILAHYIFLNFKTKSHPGRKPQGGKVTGKYKERVKTLGVLPPGTDADFELFWEVYPSHKGKSKARTEFYYKAKKKKLPTIRKLLKALRAQVKSEQWQDQDGRYIPLPVTWIHQERWNDESETHHGDDRSDHGVNVGVQGEWI